MTGFPWFARQNQRFRAARALAAVAVACIAMSCAPGRSATSAPGPGSEQGMASWYGERFQGRPTASGEPFDMGQLTAAHKTLPFGTRVRVTHLENGKSVTVRINDRGPFVTGRVIDLSRAAAAKVDMLTEGTARVKVEIVGG